MSRSERASGGSLKSNNDYNEGSRRGKSFSPVGGGGMLLFKVLRTLSVRGKLKEKASDIYLITGIIHSSVIGCRNLVVKRIFLLDN